MKKKILLIFISCMMFFSFMVSAQSPPFQTGAVEETLNIFYDQNQYIKAGQNLTLNVYVTNATDQITNQTGNCSLEIYDFLGAHKIDTIFLYSDDKFNYFLDENNFSNPGFIEIFIQCQTISEIGTLRELKEINQTGSEQTYPYLIASIFLIFTFFGFAFLIYKDREKMDDEKYWNSMFQKLHDKNYLKLSAVIVWYNIKKNVFVLYYLIGLVQVVMIYDITKVYNLTAVEPIFQIVLYLYMWGSLFVAMVFFGQVQEWIKEWLENIQKINWGEIGHVK